MGLVWVANMGLKAICLSTALGVAVVAVLCLMPWNGLRLKQPPLHAAVEKNSYDLVKKLLDEGAPVDLRNERGDTPLATALKGSHFKIADLLYHRGAKVNTLDNEGISTWEWLTSFQNKAGKDWMLDHGFKSP